MLSVNLFRKRETYIFIVSLLIFGSIATDVNTPKIYSDNFHFGGEYGNIAASIASGGGYSDPFEIESGYTSWMPPLYTYMLAFIFTLFGVKTSLSVFILLLIKYFSLSIIPVLLYRICKEYSIGFIPFLIVPIYFCLIFFSFTTFFKITQDVWFVMLLITILFYKYWKTFAVSNTKRLDYGWGIMGGLILLSSPTLGILYFVLTFLPYTKTALSKRIILILISIIICAPWCVRNYKIFNKFVFIKSNLFYELYQGNYLDDDGIYDQQTFTNFHPYSNLENRKRYALSGENDFLAEYQQKFLSKVKTEPGTYLYKTINRFFHIYILYPIFSESDKPVDMLGYFRCFIKIIIYALPFFFAVFIVCTNKGTANKELYYVAIISFFTYLFIYVFVGYSRRYRIPLVPVFTILYFYFIIYWYAKLKDQKLYNYLKSTFCKCK